MGQGALAAFLIAIAVPLAKKILVGLGIGAVTYVGVSEVFSLLQSNVLAAVGGIPAAAYQVSSLFGFQKSVGILLGAISSRLAIISFTKYAKT